MLRTLVVVLALSALAASLFLRRQETAARLLVDRRMAMLEGENERLLAVVAKAEKAKNLEALKAQRATIERAVEEIRGLKFKEPVNYNVLGRREIKAVISGKLSEVYSVEEFAAISAALSRLGMLPEGYPLRESYVSLLGEQVAAFYDQHAHKLFMFEDATLDNSQNRIVLAHELTHALADQHFGLRKLPLEIKTNDDRAVAASALVEGEATLVMSDYMMRNLSLQALKDNMAATFGQDMAQLGNAPRFLREMLVFPYLRGQEFCGALFANGGFNAITAAYANPPTSTTQILHPEKYMASQREEPIAIEWGDTTARGQKPAVDNVVGELGIRLLAGEWLVDGVERIGAGWRGDRYLSFGQGGEALVWKSTWQSEADAAEFFAAERQILEKRYKIAPGAADGAVFRADAPRVLRLQRTGVTVVLVDAPDAEWAQALETQFR